MIPAVCIRPLVTARSAGRQRAIRILHVVPSLNRGGTETWLVDLFSHMDHARFQHDVLTHESGGYPLEKAVRAAGASLIRMPTNLHLWSYEARFRRVIDEHGPYDVVHAHPHHFCGLVLRSAAHAGVPVRIAHSHSDSRGIDGRANLARRLYLRLAERWIGRYATRCLAVSAPAAASLFGEAWASDPRVSVVYSGVALEKFDHSKLDRAVLRNSLGIPADAAVFAHVGRFVEPKNHAFLVEVFNRIAQLEPSAWFALAGDGPLRSQIEARVKSAGIASRTLFLGMRDDVPELLAGLVDVLLLPSLWEGLPIALIESQAAGVPALYSDWITTESEELPRLMRRVSLREPANVWALEAISMAKLPVIRCGTGLSGSRFDIRSCAATLEEIYSKAEG